MSVTTGDIEFRSRHHVSMTVHGAGPISLEFISGRIRPDHIRISYVRPHGREWSCESIEIFGPKIRNDGTDGAVNGKVHYSHHQITSSTIPDWIPELVDRHHPGGHIEGLT